MSKKREYIRIAKHAGIKSPSIEYNRSLKQYSIAIGDVKNHHAVGYTAVYVGSYDSFQSAKDNLRTDIQDCVNRNSEEYPDIINHVSREFYQTKIRSITDYTYKQLGDIISALGSYDYDTLRDIRDLLDYQSFNDKIAETTDRRDIKALTARRNRIKLRIRGRYSTPSGDGKNWEQIQYPPALSASIDKLSPSERNILLITVKQLIHAKRPRSALRTGADGKPLARGTFQRKTKKNAFLVKNEDGTPALNEDGEKIYQDAHYLYFRIYTTNHDSTKRNASIYIGSLNRKSFKPFISAVLDAIEAQENNEAIQDYMITADDLVNAFNEGGYDAIKAWRSDMDAD